MKKHKNFIGRLLNRNNAAACGDMSKSGVDDQRMDSQTDPVTEKSKELPPEVPTMCKGGKLYQARLRNGRWETIGGPIGDC